MLTRHGRAKIARCLRPYLQYTQPLYDIQTVALFFGNIKQKDVFTASTKKAFMQTADGFYVYLGVAEFRYDIMSGRLTMISY